MSGRGVLDSSVTLDELFTVLATKRVPLAPELAGYLVLEIAEYADPNGGDVDPKCVFVSEEGTVALVKPRREAAAGDAETWVRAVLGRLLEASGSQTPALSAASKRPCGGGLAGLVEELETALIPVNRAAGRRALARLAREVRRVTLGVGRNAFPSASELAGPSRRPLPSSPPTGSQGGLGSTPPPSSASFSQAEDPTTARRPLPNELLNKATPGEWSELPTTEFAPPSSGPSSSQADVDALIEQFGVTAGGDQQHARDLKALAGLDPTPAPTAAPRDSIESLLEAGSGRGPRGPASVEAPDARAVPTGPARTTSKGATPEPFDARRRLPRPTDGRRKSMALVLLGLVALAAGAFAVWQLRTGAFGREPAERAAAATDAAPIAATQPPVCKGTLLVAGVPPHAEVLIREGQAPVDVERMPVGARLEFVATAEGYAPKRVVVAAGAPWDRGPDGKPRFEAAVQLDRSRGGADPWPAGEPGSEVGGRGPPGTVRVVATPRGAEVWMLAGIGPDARVDQIPCDREWDVLIAGPTTLRKRLHVTAADFRSEDGSAPAGSHVARISLK